jgi:hypothetical protein
LFCSRLKDVVASNEELCSKVEKFVSDHQVEDIYLSDSSDERESKHLFTFPDDKNEYQAPLPSIDLIFKNGKIERWY